MSKSFDIAAVLTVVTGVMMRKGADFQGVMDHLYPGIMTIGCAAMQPTAAEEIKRQHPKLREFLRVNAEPMPHADSLDGLVRFATMHFGESIDIEGPHEIAEGVAKAAFDKLLAKESA